MPNHTQNPSRTTEFDADAYAAVLTEQDDAYRATLTPEQLREYRIWSGEIAAYCPNCHTDNVAIEHDSGPDMVGTWWTTTCTNCGHLLDAGADGLAAAR